MVKKLIKYDFMAFAKVMLPIEIALLGVAALYRLVSIFESRTTAYEIFNTSAIIILIIAAAAAFLMTFIYSVVRFYKNLYTAEGYLSFTLPVTPSAHIASKLIVSLIFDAVTIVCAFAAFGIATAGEVFAETMKAGFFLYGKAAEMIGGQLAAYVAEFIVVVIVASATAHLLTYMCITIGQIARRHKILAAVGIYFAIYVAKQITGTVFITTGVTTGFFADLERFAANNPRLAVHLGLASAFIVEAVFGVVWFAVTQTVMKKKLNLE